MVILIAERYVVYVLNVLPKCVRNYANVIFHVTMNFEKQNGVRFSCQTRMRLINIFYALLFLGETFGYSLRRVDNNLISDLLGRRRRNMHEQALKLESKRDDLPIKGGYIDK